MKWIEIQEGHKTRFYWGSSRLLIVPGYGAVLQVKSPHFKNKFEFITLPIDDVKFDVTVDTVDEMPPLESLP